MLMSDSKLLICATIEVSLNKLLSLESGDKRRLRQLYGKVFLIQLSQLSWPFYLIFAKETQVLSCYGGEVDVSLQADITTLYRVSEGASLTELIKQDKLKLDGDLHLLQVFSQYLQEINFDIAEPVSRYLGDGLTHKLFQAGRQLKTSVLSATDATCAHLSALAIEEYRLSPHPLELREFSRQVAELANDVDSLTPRIIHLRDKMKL